MLSLLLVNLIGNLPGLTIPTLYYFYTLSLSLPFWVSLLAVVVLTQFNSFVAHLLPYGSPTGLFLVLPVIELFSQLIRPFTLMIRLSTNLSSGHIMLYMFSFFSISSAFITIVLSLALLMLMLLELGISVLQAYIFSSLMVLYVSETE